MYFVGPCLTQMTLAGSSPCYSWRSSSGSLPSLPPNGLGAKRYGSSAYCLERHGRGSCPCRPFGQVLQVARLGSLAAEQRNVTEKNIEDARQLVNSSVAQT